MPEQRSSNYSLSNVVLISSLRFFHCLALPLIAKAASFNLDFPKPSRVPSSLQILRKRLQLCGFRCNSIRRSRDLFHRSTERFSSVFLTLLFKFAPPVIMAMMRCLDNLLPSR